MASEDDGTQQDESTQEDNVLRRQESSQFTFGHVFMRDNPGKLTDRYDVDKKVMGEGSFGSVFKASCRDTKALRAVKAIELKAVKNPVRFEREINIAKQLDHPNVVRLYEVFRDAKKIYLVMELCTGKELFDRIVEEAPTGFDEAKAAPYVRQMLSALCYLHAQKFAHRDVKPENFLLQSKEPDAALKIIDFGLACQFQAGTSMTTKAGTAYYVAPEVLKGEYNEKCDIWSAGVISFILLCGYPPFAGDTDPDILKKVKEGVFEFKSPEWDGISQGAKNLVTQMLTSDPGLRPTAENLLASPWLKYKGAAAPAPLKEGFVRRLNSFHGATKLKKVALTVIAQQLPDNDIGPIQNIFRALDKNGDGKLSIEEVKEGMVKANMEVPQALDDMLKGIDCDGGGDIDYSEFLAATLERKQYLRRDVLWSAFRLFDLDGDGKITREELSRVLNNADVHQLIGTQKLDRIIAEVDADGDGAIDFEEFIKFMEMEAPANKRLRVE
jgi:calcium-dependent protein kinase